MKAKEVEAEMLKMLFVVREIRGVLQNIVRSRTTDKLVSENIMQSYVEELQTILVYLRQLPTANREPLDTSSVCHSKTSISDEKNKGGPDIISECLQELQGSHPAETPQKPPSRGFQIRLKDKDGNPGPQIQIAELVNLNHELSEENQYLQSKLAEAEGYIRKMQSQKTLLLAQLQSAKCLPQKITYQKDPVFFKLNVQIERMKAELKQSAEFIVKNNQEFIEEIQKYNQSLWKLQNEVEMLKAELEKTQITLAKKQQIILRLQSDVTHSHMKFKSLQGRQTHKLSSQYSKQLEFKESKLVGTGWLQQQSLQQKNRNQATVRRNMSPAVGLRKVV